MNKATLKEDTPNSCHAKYINPKYGGSHINSHPPWEKLNGNNQCKDSRIQVIQITDNLKVTKIGILKKL